MLSPLPYFGAEEASYTRTVHLPSPSICSLRVVLLVVSIQAEPVIVELTLPESRTSKPLDWSLSVLPATFSTPRLFSFAGTDAGVNS